MKGRLQEKNGYWYVIISRGNGLSPKWVSTGLKSNGNKRRASQMIDKIIADYEAEQQVYTIEGHADTTAKSPLFSDIIEVYLSVAKLTVKINTYEKYCYAANKHVIPYFKNARIRISDLTTLDLQTYFNKKLSTLSKKTLKDHKTVINQSLKYALETLKLIQYDPAAAVRLGKVEQPMIRYYDADHLNELLRRIAGQGPQIEAPVILAAYYGLRREEVLGLQWSSINFKDKTIVIQRTAIKTSSGTVYANTVKSKSSYRTMPLFPDVERYLKDLRNRQHEMQTTFKKGYTKNQEVCKWDDGRLIRPDYVTNRFRELIKKFDMPPLTFHQLRHSTASLLINKGYTLKEIQEWLGQADIKSTLIYSHLQYKSKENMAATIGMSLSIPKMALQSEI